MKNSIRIKIHHIPELYVYFTSFIIFICMLGIAVTIRHFSLTGLIVLLLLLFCSAEGIYIYEKRPTVIKADSDHIEYTHIAGVTSIKYSEIKNISCEPYETHTRYSSQQRIRLTIYMNNGEEYELNDAVNTSEMIKEQMNGRETDIPLIKLYEFLKEALIKAEGIVSDP